MEAVQNFKSKQVKDLVVDLRYNPGGQVAFASFCALLFADIKENDIFAKYQGNKDIKNMEDTLPLRYKDSQRVILLLPKKF
ncbi:hypothetical protein L950_0222730 [Sphingobacterium sp. IITKGP-BTPF85]|nr:hypothetical protein L950_0222730 [Sphingobacterium sp. IITKGP-BTPF85]